MMGKLMRLLKILIPDKNYNRHLVLITYSFIIFNCGSIFYGWNGFIGLLYKAGTFEDVCEGALDRKMASFSHGYSVDCSERQLQISNLSSLVVTTHIMSSPLSGTMTDLIGRKAWYSLGQIFYIVAWILIAVLPKNGNAIRASFFIIGVAAEAQIIPLIPVCKLYPKHEFLVISIMGALRSLSFVVPTILYLIFSLSSFEPSDIYKICLIYIFFSVVPSLLLGMVTIPWNIQEGNEIDDAEEIEKNKPKVSFGEWCGKMCQLLRIGIKHPTLYECILVCVCVFTQMARADILNKAQRELYTLSNGKSIQSAVGYATVLSFIPCPLFGYISDRFTPPVAFIIVQICSFISIFCLIFDNIVSKYISIIGYFFSSSYFISSIYSFINWRISKRYFGTVSATMFFFIGALLSTNFLLMKMASNDVVGWGDKRYDIIPYMCFIHSFLGIVCSIALLYITTKRAKKEIEQV